MIEITIDGVAYRVVERLGYQPSMGGQAVLIMDDREEFGRVAVRAYGGDWRLWTVEDRTKGRIR